MGSSIQGSAPLQVEEGSQGPGWEERPLTPTLLGYEVMEERAKFTVRLNSSFSHRYLWAQVLPRPYAALASLWGALSKLVLLARVCTGVVVRGGTFMPGGRVS